MYVCIAAFQQVIDRFCVRKWLVCCLAHAPSLSVLFQAYFLPPKPSQNPHSACISQAYPNIPTAPAFCKHLYPIARRVPARTRRGTHEGARDIPKNRIPTAPAFRKYGISKHPQAPAFRKHCISKHPHSAISQASPFYSKGSIETSNLKSKW